jgi:DNA-binding MarR family transcriptional regulator
MPARRTIDSRDARRLMVGMRVLSRRFCLSESDEAGCCGVTRAQAATLEALSGGGQLRLGELGRRLGIRPSTLTRNLARLEEQGLVRRIDDASDGRACCAALTEAGKRTVMGVGRREAALARAVLERIPAERSRGSTLCCPRCARRRNPAARAPSSTSWNNHRQGENDERRA